MTRFSLGQGDAVDILRTLPGECIDLVITDPAYESLEKHRAVGTTTRLTKEWFEIFPNSRFPELFAQLYRVLKRNTHCYVFCDAETMFAAKPIGEAAGFKFWKPIVWDKERIGMGYHYRAQHEFILFFEKGKRKLNNLGQSDVIRCPKVFNGYPTEKPAEVNRVLVGQSTQPGEIALDPFMGSGSAGVAALSENRDFIGFDLSARSYELAYQRLVTQGSPVPLIGGMIQPRSLPITQCPEQRSLFG